MLFFLSFSPAFLLYCKLPPLFNILFPTGNTLLLEPFYILIVLQGELRLCGMGNLGYE